MAVLPLEGMSDAKMKFVHVGTEHFITGKRIEDMGVGAGDDVFMVGRFIGHDGKQANLPSARFGNISMMPDEPLTTPLGIEQESFLVEMRSLSGYSGSPVFVYFWPMEREMFEYDPVHYPMGPWLLGVDWCHIQTYDPVLEKNGKTAVQEGYVVQSNTGMAGVVPAWRLQEFLDSSCFNDFRQRDDEDIAKAITGGATFG